MDAGAAASPQGRAPYSDVQISNSCSGSSWTSSNPAGAFSSMCGNTTIEEVFRVTQLDVF